MQCIITEKKSNQIKPGQTVNTNPPHNGCYTTQWTNNNIITEVERISAKRKVMPQSHTRDQPTASKGVNLPTVAPLAVIFPPGKDER